MTEWNKFESIAPIDSDYPIVVVSKKEDKDRDVYNIEVVLEGISLHS